jgi:general L-amino acid transport system permease protein
MLPGRAPPPKTRSFSLRSRAVRGLLYQLLALAVVILGVWFLAHNTLENMRTRGIQSGFDFLGQPAGFDIGETLIPYESMRPYWQAFLVGVVNTLRVAIVGIVLTTLLGTLLGIGRFSSNALVRGFCYAYVELFRNVPILLQLLVWYLLLTEWLPNADTALSAFGLVFLSKGGLSYPVPVWGLAHGLAVLGAVAGGVGAWAWARLARAHFQRTGQTRAVALPGLGFVLLGCVLGTLAGAYLSAQTGHWVGGSLSDAQGLPVVGWSRDGGDLRVAHFFGLHAMQALPLVAWAAAQLRATRTGVHITHASAVACVALTAFTFIQALRGQPFI